MTKAHELDSGPGWSFGRFRLLMGRGLFDDAGDEIPIAPKPLGVLVHLLRNHDRIVDRSELLEAVWPGISVSEAALSSVLRDLRRTLGESANDDGVLQTMRGRGLRVTAPVEEIAGEKPPNKWDETEEHLERALAALDLVGRSRGLARDPTERARADLLVALARVQWAGGATDSARDVFLEATSLGRQIGDPAIFARAALGYAGRTDVPTHLAAEVVALLEEALTVVSPEDLLLGSEVRARLATEVAIGPDVERADRLAREAVERATKSGDQGAIGYALTARHFVLERAGGPLDERKAASLAAQAAVSGRAASDVRALGQQQELIDRLESAERVRFDEVLDAYEATAAELGQRFFDWMHAVFATTQRHLDGNLDEAESQAVAAHALGQQAGSPNADFAFAGQLFAIRRDQGRLGELLPLVDALDGAVAHRHVIEAARAAILGELGREDDARAALERAMGHGLEQIPRDHYWMTTLALLAPVLARFGRAEEQAVLHALLAPFADRIVVFAHGVAALGAVAEGLGELSRSLGHDAQATAELMRARALHESLGAPRWIARVDDRLRAIAH